MIPIPENGEISFRNGLTPYDYALWISIRMLIIIAFIIISLIIILSVGVLTGNAGPLMFFMVPFLIFVLLIWIIFLYLYAKNANATHNYLEENIVFIKGEDLIINLRVYPISSVFKTTIKIENILSVSNINQNYWNQCWDNTTFPFKLLYIRPKPPVFGQYLIFSNLKDLLQINLRENIEASNYNYPFGSSNEVLTDLCDRIIVNIHPHQTEEFIKLITKKTKRG